MRGNPWTNDDRLEQRKLVVTFALALLVLVLNDHLLKGAGLLPPSITGKLSDVAGLAVAPVVLGLLLRRLGMAARQAALAACLGVGTGFGALQLSPVFAADIDALLDASLGALTGARSHSVSDPSDLFALPMLLVGFRIASRVRVPEGLGARATVMLASLACVATSMPLLPVGPHWGFVADDARSERATLPLRHGLLELYMGKASVEGSFELGLCLYAYDTEIQLRLDEVSAWLGLQRVAAQAQRDVERVIVVPPGGRASATVHFIVEQPPQGREVDDADEFDEFEPVAGQLVIPLHAGQTESTVVVPLAFAPRTERQLNRGRFAFKRDEE